MSRDHEIRSLSKYIIYHIRRIMKIEDDIFQAQETMDGH